jgi:polyamine oxidase
MFLDGGTEVPAPVEGAVERVIVVGAGIAGLTVANALRHAGVPCVVLEARDRIGGRLHTADLAGIATDLGGSWIHHPIGNPLHALASQWGVSFRPGDPLPSLSGYDCATSSTLADDDVAEHIRFLYEDFPTACAELAVRLGPDASIASAIDIFLSEAGLDDITAERARQGLRAIVEAESAALSEDQSLRWMWNEIEYGGDFFGDLPVGGYRSVVEPLALGSDIRLGVEVTSIDIASGGVTVLTADGHSERGSHVVLTVPLGVLKAGLPRVFPALPADRLAAIDRLGFGHFEKIALAFEEPFWRTSGRRHLMLFPSDRAEATVWVFDHDSFGAGPSLVGLVFQSASGHVLDGSADDAVAWLTGMLDKAFGAPCPRPSATAVTAWGNDPFARGAYTHIPPGAAPGDADLLGEPVHGRLLFAGEHTQSSRLAYTDGAFSSGVREARRLLQQSHVRIE